MLTLFYRSRGHCSYTTKFVTLNLLWLPPTESTFIDQIRKLLLHEIVDQFDCLLKALLAHASYMEV